MDWSEKDLCIKCNEGGNLLVCSEDGCPLAVHEECMGCTTRFDDAGRFYCPYCLYKRAVAESRRAREYALARKKALLLFMDEKMMGSEKHIEENKRAEDNGHNESKTREANVKIITCNDGKSKSNSDAILDQPIQLDEERKIGNAEEEKIQEEESEASAGSKCQEPSHKLHEEQSLSNEEEKKNQEEEQSISNEEEKKNQEEEESISNEEGKKNQEEEQSIRNEEGKRNQEEEQSIRNEEEKKNREEEHETSAASSGQDPLLEMHERKICDSEEEKIQEEERETLSASSGEDPSLSVQTRAKRGFKRRKPVDRDSEAVSVRSKLRKQLDKNKPTSPTVNSPRKSSRRSSSALKNEKASNYVVGSSKKSKQPEQSSVKLPSDVFGSGKRKRLLWTEKEEETLKAGVEKYSKEANKNIPWRKILDLGSHVFDATRTPGDLKDKWRNMSAK